MRLKRNLKDFEMNHRWIPTYLSAMVFVGSLIYYQANQDHSTPRAMSAIKSRPRSEFLEGTNIRRDLSNLDSLYNHYFGKHD